MKKLLLSSIAALLLATGAQAEEPRHQLAFVAPAEDVWHFNDYKRCTARVEFKIPPNPKDWLLRTDLSLANDTAAVMFDRTNLAKLEAAGGLIRIKRKGVGRAAKITLTWRPS